MALVFYWIKESFSIPLWTQMCVKKGNVPIKSKLIIKHILIFPGVVFPHDISKARRAGHRYYTRRAYSHLLKNFAKFLRFLN